MRRSFLALVTLACGLLASTQAARAGGLEYTGQGAMSLARGGAVAARAEDPMVLAHNPAGLVELRGSKFLLNVNLALFDACVDPAGYYGWGIYLGGEPLNIPDPNGGDPELIPLNQFDSEGNSLAADYYTDPLDTVCLDQNIVPIPQIAWTRRVSEDFGIGFGLIFPSVQPSGRWGGKYGVIRGDTGELRPAPTRYMGLESNNLGIFPTFGAAYRFSHLLRLGLSLEAGIIAVNNYTMAGAVGGTLPSNDIVAHVKAQDWFVPAFTASLHLVPIDALDVVLAFRFQDDLEAQGDIDLLTGVFGQAFRPYQNGHLPITSLRQNMPWKVRAGVRYADRYEPRPRGTGRDDADPSKAEVVHGPLQDERWDVELDVEYQINSRNDRQVLNYEIGHQVLFAPPDPMLMPSGTDFPDPSVPNTTIEKQWQDQISLRLGGTYNLVPGKLGLSAGAHLENQGIDPDYMQTDFWPVARLGLHGGVVVRVARSIDFVFAYAHIFQQTIIVAPPEHLDRTSIGMQLAAGGGITNIDKQVGAWADRAGTGRPVLEAPSQGEADGVAKLKQNVQKSPAEQPPMLVNSGRYRSNFDILAVGVNVHF